MEKKKLTPQLRFPEFKNAGEWTEKKLGLLTNTTIGEFVIRTKQNPNSPYPVYNGGISYTGFYDDYNNEANKIVISARGANAGFVNLVRQKYWAGNSCYSVEVLDKDIINLELLFYYIKHNQRRFTNNQQAANIPSISKSDVEKFLICYPENIFEQQKIASCLSSLDEVIEFHTQKLELLQEHKKGLLQNLFPQEGEKVPQLRFKEFENDGEWEEKTLGEVGNFIGGGTPNTSIQEYWDGEIHWYTPTEVKNGKLTSSIRKITEQGLKNSSAKLLPEGTILITTRATIGEVAITKNECTTNQGFQSLIVNDSEVNLFWLYWLLQHKKELLKRASGSTFKEIGKNEITNIPTLSPKKQEQQKIASCLSSLDETIETQAEKIEQLKMHKKGLMQGLFPSTV